MKLVLVGASLGRASLSLLGVMNAGLEKQTDLSEMFVSKHYFYIHTKRSKLPTNAKAAKRELGWITKTSVWSRYIRCSLGLKIPYYLK